MTLIFAKFLFVVKVCNFLSENLFNKPRGKH